MKPGQLVLSALLCAAAMGAQAEGPGAALADTAMKTHGLQAWWGVKAVQATVDIEFGGKKMLDGAAFYFEAHGPRARYQMGDQVVVFDGHTAWATPPEKADPMTRFHVWTWPWFIYAPFKMRGDGIHLSDARTVTFRGVAYDTVLQTFEPGEGDTPEDWYRLFIHPETHMLDAMSYIVTYGRSAEDANKQASIILYSDYQDLDGIKIAGRYEFWYWDPAKAQREGDTPKGRGTISGIRLNASVDESQFAVPSDAVEVSLPGS